MFDAHVVLVWICERMWRHHCQGFPKHLVASLQVYLSTFWAKHPQTFDPEPYDLQALKRFSKFRAMELRHTISDGLQASRACAHHDIIILHYVVRQIAWKHPWNAPSPYNIRCLQRKNNKHLVRAHTTTSSYCIMSSSILLRNTHEERPCLSVYRSHR